MTNWHQWQKRRAASATLEHHEEQSWPRAYGYCMQDRRGQIEPQRCSCWEHDVRQEAHGLCAPWGKKHLSYHLHPSWFTWVTWGTQTEELCHRILIAVKIGGRVPVMSQVGELHGGHSSCSWVGHSHRVSVLVTSHWDCCLQNERKILNRSPMSLATTRFWFRVSTWQACPKKGWLGRAKGFIPIMITKGKGRWQTSQLLYLIPWTIPSAGSIHPLPTLQPGTHLTCHQCHVSRWGDGWAITSLRQDSALGNDSYWYFDCLLPPPSQGPQPYQHLDYLIPIREGCLRALGTFGSLSPSLGPLPHNNKLDDVSSLPGRTGRQLHILWS